MLHLRESCAAALSVVALATTAQTGRAPQLPLAPRAAHWEAYAMDSHRGALVRFGGSTGVRDGRVEYDGATWEWTGDGWRRTVPAETGPGARHAHGMAYHPDRRQVFLAGGVRVEEGKEQSLCDTWSYDGRQWTRLRDGPCGGAGATLVFDTGRRWLLWIEGDPLTPGSDQRPLRLWRWTPERWLPFESPGPRGIHTARAAFDERRQVLVVLAFAGPDAGVWEWNGQSWRHAPASGPAPRTAFGFAYDPATSRTILVGGRSDRSRAPLADLWTWDGDRWQEQTSLPDPSPGARSHATLIGTRERMLYVGGSAGGPLLDEIWIRTANRWRRWTLP